jgi:Ser/Thr protein kinase RdoA (MazF antagonist)
VWNDHVLFSEEAVSGLVDFGSVRIDHASVDLARLLGSLVGDDREGWEAGLDAYKALRPLSLTEQGLARALDQTGTILGMANWLRWLYLERRVFVDRQAVADRLGALVRRIEGWG